MAKIAETKDCFIIMPISDPDGYEDGHFQHVYEDLVSPACASAGYRPLRANDVLQTNLIHLDILKSLLETPMAVCDLSTRNPNVLFELGLRQAFDKPVVLIQEKGTPQIFDIAPLRYTEYRKERVYHEVLEDQESISEALKATAEATQKGDGLNSIVNLLSLTTPAAFKEFSLKETNPMMQVVMAEVSALRNDLRNAVRALDQTTEFRARESSTGLERARSALREAERMILSADDDDLGQLHHGMSLCKEAMALTQKDYAHPRLRSPQSRKEVRMLTVQAEELREHAAELIRRHASKSES